MHSKCKYFALFFDLFMLFSDATWIVFFRPESLGIVVGIVFLVVAILFQYFNFTADSNVSIIFHSSQCTVFKIPLNR